MNDKKLDYEISRLNNNQRKAVIHENGPLFVVAGAGTGKTKTLTTRIAYLIEKMNVDPNRILGVTFTNKAAKEIRHRVNDLIYPNQMGAWLYTFHAFGLRVLRENAVNLNLGYKNDFTVIDEDDALAIIRDIIKKQNIDAKKYPPRMIKNFISNEKTFIRNIDDEVVRDVYDRYKLELIKEQLMDFDDLIVYTNKLFKENLLVRTKYQTLFTHILIDEFQDTDKVQYEIIKLLNNENTFVVGDPDQSIYAFRGARYENNQLFVKEFGAEVIVLDENYRSTNNILKAANKLIKNNNSRTTDKNLVSSFGDGVPIVVHLASDDFDEVRTVTNEIINLTSHKYNYEDIAVLYRNNHLSRLFEHSFMQTQIPYIIYGGISFYERKEVKDILAYLKVVVDTNSNFYLKRIINTPTRGIGNVTINKLEEYANFNNMSMFDAIDYVKFSAKTANSLKEFKNIINELKEKIEETKELVNIIDVLFVGSGYYEFLKEETDDKAKERKENIMELKNVFRQGDWNYEGNNIEKIKQILDELALYTDHDKDNQDLNVVKLATVHQVKGLEFKVVFVVALEDGLFPSDRSYMDPFELEEERRIFYVAITRAKERLYVTNTQRRMVYGQIKNNIPSVFLREIKNDEEKILPKKYSRETINKNTSSDDFKSGDIVVHDSFGKGVVVEVKDDIITIAFNVEYGIKKLLKNHPSIKKEI
ncbi:ATP-dependent helicase [Haploplasma axanthum]|uniref:DNA 3'-5' helicase n=1 Tax=Haploplasma axanthum TaxID=29552 RepID=A0A449BB81_HAPAX|nr:UvrD-helicase domain-containing protein [Haploplasma axanthum]VEU79591.1 ATP-dependent DNA helicase UvrD/PcrA [Haploplasma axanthum]